LGLALTRPRQSSILANSGIRIVAIWLRCAREVPLFGSFERKKSVQHLGMSFWIFPIFRDLGLLGTKARFVDVAVLDDERVQSIWVRQNDTEPDRRAVIVEVHGVMCELQLLQEIIYRLGKMIERVSVVGRGGCVAQTESWIIWSDQMILCCEQGNERVKLK
jgi:hypothetical protein